MAVISLSKNRILPFEAILSKSGESWVVGGVASNFFRDLDGDAIAPDAIARAIPAFMANRGPDGLKGGPLRLHHGFWERFLKQSINSLNIPYADQMGMLAAIALPLGRVTEMTVEPDGTTRWRGLLSQANPIAKVIWEMLKEGLVHLGVSVGGKINATRPGRDALGRPCTVICDVRLDELSITDNPANRLIESEAADNGAYIMALAKSLQTTVSPSPVDRFLEQVLDDNLSKAARQKLQEGATKQVNGVTYVLNKKRRWTRAEPRGKRSSQHWGNTLNDGGAPAANPAAKPARKPRAKAAPQQLSLIPDGTPSKVKPKAQKGKQWGAAQQPQASAAVGGAAMGASTLRPKKTSPLPKPSTLGDDDVFEKPKAKGKGKKKADPSLGELALRPKAGLEGTSESSSAPEAEESPDIDSWLDEINAKYDPNTLSPKDADEWLKEATNAYLEGSHPASIEAGALVVAKRELGLWMGNNEDEQKRYNNIRTKQQLYEAVIQRDQDRLDELKQRTGRDYYEPSDFRYDFYSSKDLEDAERRVKTGRTEKSRAAALEEVEKIKASLVESQEIAEKNARKANERVAMSRDEKIKRLDKQWESFKETTIQERQALKKDIDASEKAIKKYFNNKKGTKVKFPQRAMNKGHDATIAAQDNVMAALGIKMNYRSLDENADNYEQVQAEAVREYLHGVRQRSGGDAKVLGLSTNKPSAKELKQAYRRAASQHHPDHGGSREKFDQVRAAYERMMDDHYPDLKKSLIPYIPKTTMAKVNRFLHKALGGSPGGEINSGSWRDTAIPSMGRGLGANSTNKPTGTKPVRLDASSSDTAARGIGGKQPKAQRPYSSGGMPPTDVWGMTVGQLTRELSKCCGMTKDAWGSPETSGFLTDAAHGLVGLTESPHPELINFVRFLQYLNQFAQQIPHMDDYQAAGTVAAMNTDLTKALGDFTENLPAELKGRALRPPGSPGVRGIDIQFPSQYIVYS